MRRESRHSIFIQLRNVTPLFLVLHLKIKGIKPQGEPSTHKELTKPRAGLAARAAGH
jgi:hypothetical protein